MLTRSACESFELKLRDGTKISLQRRGSGPRILFSHGGGFACAAFDSFLKLLAENFEVFSYDLRGHGLTESLNATQDIQAFCVNLLFEDFVEITALLRDQFGPLPMWGVFHSISSVIALQAISKHAGILKGLVAFEPPLAGIGKWKAISDADRESLAARTYKRTSRFKNPAVLQKKFGRHMNSKLMGDAHASELALALLRECADGEFELRCRPEIEARIYETNQHFGLWNELARIAEPVWIMAGRCEGKADYPSAIAPEIAAAGKFELISEQGWSHLGWIEYPEQAASMVADLLNRG